MVLFLRRLMTNRRTQCIGVIMMVGAIWAIWWFLPERPIHELHIQGKGLKRVVFSRRERVAYLEYRTDDRQPAKPALIRLGDGVNILPSAIQEKFAHHSGVSSVSPMFFEDSRTLLLSAPSSMHLLDIPSGNVKWSDDQLGYHRNWSSDGRYLAFSSRQVPEKLDQTILLDTKELRSSNLLNATGPFCFDLRGTQLLTLVDGDPKAFIVWDTTTQKVIKTLRDSRWVVIVNAAISPDGQKAVIMGRVNDRGGAESNAAYLWDLSSERVDELTVPVAVTQPLHPDLSFSADGTTVSNLGNDLNWNVSTSPPTFVFSPIKDRWLDLPAVNRYFLREQLRRPTDNEGDWTMHDRVTDVELARGRWTLLPIAYVAFIRASDDHRWAVIQRDAHQEVRFHRFWNWWYRFTQTVPEPQWCDVVSLQNGRVTNQIPGAHGTMLQFTDNDRLWTFADHDRTFDNRKLVLREWSCVAAAPPWWLWLLTLVAIIATCNVFFGRASSIARLTHTTI